MFLTHRILTLSGNFWRYRFISLTVMPSLRTQNSSDDVCICALTSSTSDAFFSCAGDSIAGTRARRATPRLPPQAFAVASAEDVEMAARHAAAVA